MYYQYQHGRILFDAEFDSDLDITAITTFGIVRERLNPHGYHSIDFIEDEDLSNALAEVESERLDDPQFVISLRKDAIKKWEENAQDEKDMDDYYDRREI